MPKRALQSRLISIGLVILLVSQTFLHPKGVSGAPSPQGGAANTYFLPAVMKRAPSTPHFGVESEASITSGLPRVGAAGIQYLRYVGFNWAAIEPVRTDPPTYQWSAVDGAFLQAVARRGIQLIATVKFTPAWAQKVPPYTCGPVSESALPAFAQFMVAVVARYGVAPYNIRYWELGNEIDVAPTQVPPNNIFGCWGDATDPYFGGGYYATMLKTVYPDIKAADPRAQVLLGSLLLDCDPTNPPAGRDCKPSMFLEGILKNGGGGYFDIVGFHGFNLYFGGLQFDGQTPSWGSRGGVILGKINFIREVLARYNANKPIFNTEGALLCPEYNTAQCNPPGPAFNEAQADYAVWLYVRNLAAGIPVTIWFVYNPAGSGWRYSGLLDASGNPKPVYYAIQTLTDELNGSTFTREITQYPGVRAYEFAAGTQRTWVLWSPDELPHTISLPAGVRQVRDKYGVPITPNGLQLTLNSPVYVELN